MIGYSIFTCGPFADASKSVELFAASLYFSQVYHETMMEHEKLEIKLKEAKENNDELATKHIEEQISFIENAYGTPLYIDPKELIN